MKVEVFEMERFQSIWENRVTHNLSESGVHPMSLRELVDEKERDAILDRRFVYVQTNGTPVYIPSLLADLACAYNGTALSIPSLSVNGTTQYFFHAITVGTGVPTVNIYSPGTAAAAGTPPAGVVIDTIGVQYVTLQFESSTGTMGAFYAFL